MGNLISNDQFKTNLKELMENKKIKKTLKIIYKEKQGQLLSIQSCEIIKHFHTIQQRLDYKNYDFQHNCKIILDIDEKQRTYRECNVCKKKVKPNRSYTFCSNCKQSTQITHSFCSVVKLIDANSLQNQDSYKAIMFEVAQNFLNVSAKEFDSWSSESQNDHYQKINQQKSHITYLLLLQYKPERENFVIKQIIQNENNSDQIS
ncbi:unnamed protein product [Paramecium sonneborni]|uniref:Uncharacterized protein n=1 Tax=Paramecium sonneborni TaxID=65129 RepID=A0A8S1JTN6_9CILI|nr:unnamed protein product [Paramecium sonneborni]